MAVTPPTPDPTPDPTPGPGARPAATGFGSAGSNSAGSSSVGSGSAGFGSAPGVAPQTGSPHAGRFPPEEPNGSGAHASWKDATTSILERIGEIREYVSYYAETKTDGIKQSAIWAGIYAALGILGGLIGAAVLVTAAVLLVNGIAGGLGALFGGRAWLGQLVTGLLLLGGLAVGVVVGLKVLRSSFKKKLRAKYEQRHQDQRARFGADVPQRARERQDQPA
jgi:hypothetical protein